MVWFSHFARKTPLERKKAFGLEKTVPEHFLRSKWQKTHVFLKQSRKSNLEGYQVYICIYICLYFYINIFLLYWCENENHSLVDPPPFRSCRRSRPSSFLRCPDSSKASSRSWRRPGPSDVWFLAPRPLWTDVFGLRTGEGVQAKGSPPPMP